MNTTGANTILLDLNTRNALKLLVEPALTYENPVQSNLGLYKFEFGRDKMRMLHFRKTKYTLQPKSNCKTWNPNVRLGLRADEIGVEDYELNAEQCLDEYDEGCARNLRGNPNEIQRIQESNPVLDEIDAATIMLLRESMKDDFYRIAYFGNKNFGALLDAGYYAPNLSPMEKENLVAMMEVTNGWWGEIEARVHETDEFAKVRYVDSNNGTGDGNAINPANVTDYLDQLRASSHIILLNWHRNKPISERPKFVVQGGIFNAYKKYLKALGTEAAHKFIMEGETITGVLEYDGFLVVENPDWDMWDTEMGMWDKMNNRSKIQRALFTANENLCGLFNMRSLENFPESALVIQTSPLVRDKGRKDMYASFGLGFGVAQPVLMTASWNSSQDFQF